MGDVVMRAVAGAASHPGRLRETNQDAYLARSPVFLVADGMGGHADGALAARTVVEAFDHVDGRWLTPTDLHEALATAGHQLGALGALGTSDPAPGSTVSGCGLADHDGVPCWLVFNVGDSRTYRLHEGTLEQITVDHTHVQDLVDGGKLLAEDAKDHRLRNVITRALGAGATRTPVPDQWLLIAHPGDRMLVCSDGLWGELTDQLMTAILMTAQDPQLAADELVAAAVAASGRDNVTAVVVDVTEVRAAGSVVVSDSDVTDPGSPLEVPTGHTLPDLDSLLDHEGARP